jgi:hypothetical protein
LQNVDASVLDELSEAVLCVLVLASRPLDGRKRGLEESVTVKVVGMQALWIAKEGNSVSSVVLGEMKGREGRREGDTHLRTS